MFVGFLLLGLAVWSFAWDGFNSSTLMVAAAAAFIFVRAAQGMGLGEVGDPLAVIEFVRNPADAIVDSATERLGDWLTADEPTSGREEEGKFNPDAVVARYLEQRGSEPAAASPAATSIPAPMRSFGRKVV